MTSGSRWGWLCRPPRVGAPGGWGAAGAGRCTRRPSTTRWRVAGTTDPLGEVTQHKYGAPVRRCPELRHRGPPGLWPGTMVGMVSCCRHVSASESLSVGRSAGGSDRPWREGRTRLCRGPRGDGTRRSVQSRRCPPAASSIGVATPRARRACEVVSVTADMVTYGSPDEFGRTPTCCGARRPQRTTGESEHEP